MKFRFYGLLILCLWTLSAYSQDRPFPFLDPQDQYKDLYKEVELGQIFKDSKTFADAIPKFTVEQIMSDYERQKNQAGFSLYQFVLDHFIIPQSFTGSYKTNPNASTSDHIAELWTVLTHTADHTGENSNTGTLIPLPNPYIVPGGRFREIYYWDSYFSCLGLEQDHRVDLIENIINNFAHLINTLGHIPNGNRTYYLGRSQPPFFGPMVGLLADIQGQQVLVNYLPEMEKEYYYWMAGKDLLQKRKLEKPKNLKSKTVPFIPQTNLKVVQLAPGVYLNRYCDELSTPRAESFREDYLAVNLAYKDEPSKALAYQNIRSAAESGWDFSSRWFNGQKDIAHLNTIDLIPVDLNCILYYLELKISRAHYLDNDSINGLRYETLAIDRKKAIMRYLWDEKEGYFLDYNYTSHKPSPVKSLAMVYPLFFQVASPDEAQGVAKEIKAEFLKPGGLTTTLNFTGQQWDAPNGWAPLQYLAIQGFRNYHMDSLAETIAQRWLHLNEKVFKATGKMQEKYNVVDTTLVGGGGEYPNQDGFGWTNGVYRKLESIYNH
jgi:alpha,alpha-trehalase